MKHGRNLIVALDGVPIAGAKSCKFNIAQNFLKACSPTDGRAKNKIPTDYDWSVSCDCLIPNSNPPVSLKDKLIAGTKCLLTFTDGDGDNRAGFVYVKSCDEDGTIGNLAKFSASFESSGALYKYVKYTPALFTEGNGAGIVISNNTLTYVWSQGPDLGGVQIKPDNDGQLLVLNNEDEVWAWYQDTFSNIKTYITNQNASSLNEKLKKFGDTTDMFAVNKNTTYTFLANDGPFVLFLLYQ